MNLYEYNGPVVNFGVCVQNNFKAKTMAPTVEKARSNIMYQWKKRNGYIPSVKIELPGKITLMEEKGK